MSTGIILGLGLTTTRAPAYDPADLTLTQWNRIAYSGSPWAGVASGGGSGGRALSEGTNPPSAGAALNGLDSVSFDGTNDRLGGDTLGNVLPVNGWALGLLLNIVAVSSSSSSAEGEILSDTLGTFCLQSYDAGGGIYRVSVQQYDTGWRRAEVGVALATWTFVQARYNGATLGVRINGGSWTTTACGDNASGAGSFQVGQSRAAFGLFYSGLVAEVFAGAAISDGDFDGLRIYLNSRYALSV